MEKKKHLVIVESPAKAKTINKILKSGYIVKASYGHVRDLPVKGGINIDLETFDCNYEIMKDPRKQKIVNNLKEIAKKSDKIFLCPDRDREGEAIAYHLSEILDVPKNKFVRVTFNEITSKAIKKAFENPHDIDMDLVNAQQARRFLDRIVGYKLSPLLWEKIVRGLSAGRVQSVTVKIISEREKEIKAFNPQEYWTVNGTFGKEKENFNADLREIDKRKIIYNAKGLDNIKNKYHIKNKESAKQVVENCLMSGSKKREYKVINYIQKDISEKAMPPFITSTLQQAAATRLGFDAARTMRVAQKLYEAGHITYMRTDSLNVSKEAIEAASLYIRSNIGDDYYPDKQNFYKSRKGAQEAHECVRPTCIEQCPGSLSLPNKEEGNLYKLIWERFIASQMSPARYKATVCDLGSGGQVVFRATGRVKDFSGWTKVYGVDGKNKLLPKMKQGQSVSILKIEQEQHFTQPPSRFNDASLVKTLEASGVGRPSTYASIIKTIINRKYVERIGSGGRAPLKATDLGIIVTDSLKDHFAIMDIKFTREMEEKLDEVERGNLMYKDLLKDFWLGFKAELKAAKTNMISTKEGKPSKHKCLKCKHKMSERISQYGSFFKCLSEDCGATFEKGEDELPKEKEGPKKTGLKCDICKSDMVLTAGRFGEYICCEKYLIKTEKKVDGKKKPVKVPECLFTMKLTKKGEPRRKITPTKTDIECEKCKQGNMVIRIASRKKQPDAFLSCSRFPKCRETDTLPEYLSKEGENLLGEFRKLRAKDNEDIPVFKLFIERMNKNE